jgi:hypothetical protein
MDRIPTHTLDSAPDASQPYLQALLHAPGGMGRILNLQAQLAHAPVVMAAYTGMRKAVEEHATLEFATRSAIQLAVSTVDNSAYSLALNTMLARRAGWPDDAVAAICAGAYTADGKLTALLDVIRQAAVSRGQVDDGTWEAARRAGWGDTELAEAYMYLALTRFVDDFVAYAGTELDLPAAPAA